MIRGPLQRLRAVLIILVAWLASLRLVVFFALHQDNPTIGGRSIDAMLIRPQFVLFGDSLTQHGFNEGRCRVTPQGF